MRPFTPWRCATQYNVSAEFASEWPWLLRRQPVRVRSLVEGLLFGSVDPANEVLTTPLARAYGFIDANPVSVPVDYILLETSDGESLSFIGGSLPVLNGAW